MISKYKDFLTDKKFNSIINESVGKWLDDKTIVWDMENKEEEQKITFEWDLTKPEKTKNKLNIFLSRLSKEKIKYYFYKLLEKLKVVPKVFRKKLVISYTMVFLSFVSYDYLKPEEENKERTDIFEDYKDVFEEIGTEPKKETKFDIAQKIVKKVEKGYSEDKDDTGNYITLKNGEEKFIGTNHGISAPILKEYLGRTPTKEEMMNLSYETALKIFKNKFWDKQNISEFKNQKVANLIYDACVNQGINGTKKILRKAYRKNGIEIKNTGNPFSLKFIKKVNKFWIDQEKLFYDIKKERKNKYKASKTYYKHGSGWLSRLNSLKF